MARYEREQGTLAGFRRQIDALERQVRDLQTRASVSFPGHELGALRIHPEHGWIAPAIPGAWVEEGAHVDIATSVWTPAYAARWHAAVAGVIVSEIPWQTFGGGGGELRVSNVVSGGATTDVITLPVDGSGFIALEWLHQQPLGSGPMQPRIEARRTSGSGTVRVFQPNQLYQVGEQIRSDATLGGLWHI